MRLMLGVLALFVAVGCGSVHSNSPDAAPVTPDAPAGCTANATSCGSDMALYQCDMDGAQQTKVQDCQYGCTTDHCNQCQANTTFCSGNDLVMCSGTGSITNPMTCQNGCQNNACNACMPNTKYCSGATAVTCGADGQPGAMQNCGAAGCNGGVCNSCTPNTTTCQGDTLVVCNGGGTVASTTNCALGCSTTGTTHCNALVPSFGVGAPSGNLPSLAITADSTLDISGCANLNVLLTIGTTTTAVPTNQVSVVAQNGGPPICVVRYGTITINDPYNLNVVNSASGGHMLSLQSVGDFNLTGKISFGNAAPGPTPGGTVFVIAQNSANYWTAPGAGGGGGARAGGTGGTCMGCSGDVPGGFGGAAVTNSATVLNGGSSGGNVQAGSTVYGGGGYGGGGLQLVSLTRVTIAASAVINLNGGGGWGPIKGYYAQTAGGGGAGGQLVVEAPTVNVSAGAIAVANGGGGSGGGWYAINVGGLPRFYHYSGYSGQLSTARAAGGDIPNTTNGDGGYEADGTATPSINGSPSDQGATMYDGGGGGGSRGFITLNARTMTNVMVAFGAIISPNPTIGAVVAR